MSKATRIRSRKSKRRRIQTIRRRYRRRLGGNGEEKPQFMELYTRYKPKRSFLKKIRDFFLKTREEKTWEMFNKYYVLNVQDLETYIYRNYSKDPRVLVIYKSIQLILLLFTGFTSVDKLFHHIENIPYEEIDPLIEKNRVDINRRFNEFFYKDRFDNALQEKKLITYLSWDIPQTNLLIEALSVYFGNLEDECFEEIQEIAMGNKCPTYAYDLIDYMLFVLNRHLWNLKHNPANVDTQQRHPQNPVVISEPSQQLG